MKIGLVGRTNVGKSTLFNRLLGTYRAIVTEIAGTTREILSETTTLRDKPVVLLDSPGLANFEDELRFIEQIVNEADILLFVVDGKQELTTQDKRIQELIHQAHKKARTLLVVNKLDSKVDHPDLDELIAEYYALGFDQIVPISAQQIEGVEELVDQIEGRVVREGIDRQRPEQAEDGPGTIPLVIMGRPNVGKSTLLNMIVGEQIAHVQDKPGTTLDYLTASIVRRDRQYQLYDTAGIKKKGKTKGLEKIAYEKTFSLIRHVRPVVVYLIDADEGVTHRDKSLLGEIIREGVPVVIGVNKIDLFSPDQKKRMLVQVDDKLLFASWAPIVAVSAMARLGVGQLLQEVAQVWDAANYRIPTSKLNKKLKQARVTAPPRFPKNKICKRKYATQVDTAPPTFVLSVNNDAYVNFAFVRRLENVIRQEWGFVGSPVRFSFESKDEDNPYRQR